MSFTALLGAGEPLNGTVVYAEWSVSPRHLSLIGKAEESQGFIMKSGKCCDGVIAGVLVF